MAIFDQEHRPPEPDEFDTGYAVVRAALGGVPLLGSAAQELLQRIIAPPLARRQQEWAESIGAAVRQLEEHKGVTPEQLRDNPAFVDAVLAATQAAIRTSQEEKRVALLNATVNSALPGAPEIAEQQMFISLVDRFTEWHLRLLKLIQNPKGNEKVRDGYRPAISGSLSQLIEVAFPELVGRRDLYDQVWADLAAAGMHRSGSLQTMMSTDGPLQKRTTEIGDRFLRFIESPF
jgi:hypothetical protein